MSETSRLMFRKQQVKSVAAGAVEHRLRLAELGGEPVEALVEAVALHGARRLDVPLGRG